MENDFKLKFIGRLYSIASQKEKGISGPFAQLKKDSHELGNNFLAMNQFDLCTNEISDNDIEILRIIASLFTIYPTSNGEQRLYTLAEILSSINKEFKSANNQSITTIELKFNHLLKCDITDLPILLSKILRFIKSKSVLPLNYLNLLNALIFWDSDDKNIQKFWAKDFWLCKNDSGKANSEETIDINNN